MPQDRRAILDTTVRSLRQRLRKIDEGSRAIGEENTKRVLITPLLEALNWEVLDLEEVRNEYRAKPQDNPVDYALFLHRSPCLFLEAKSLDNSLEDRKWIGQTIGYASMAGVDWCVLTNGDEYRIYNAHASMDAERKLFRRITLSDEASHAFTVETLELISKEWMGEKRIDTLWKSHFVDQRVNGVLEELFQGDDSFIRLIAKREPSLTQGEIRQSLQRANLRITFPAPVIPQAKSTSTSTTKKTASASKTGPVALPPACEPETGSRVTLRAIIAAGLVQAPFGLEVTYKKQRYEATVEADGTITCLGQSYLSPSTACSALRHGKSCNGLAFWSFRDDQGELQLLDLLRQAYLARTGTPAGAK